MQNSVIFLMGPTASGKTALAMQLAARLPVDLISVDSAQVYRGMDIGTGKPTAAELAQIPQQLIDICDPAEVYSAARFCTDAHTAIQQSWQRGRIPLLVGGTMLYFKALRFGLAPLPEADAQLRAEILAMGDMHAQLAARDPNAAQRLNPNDTQRVQRALEINIITGKTLTENFAQQQQQTQQLNCQIYNFAIMPPDRADLHNKIATRFYQMLDQGLIAEVEQLYKRGDLNINLPSMRAVGYRQVWKYLAGETEYQQMCEQAIAATRQLAKRQYTWLRSWTAVIALENPKPTKTLDTITDYVLHSLEI